MRVNLALEIARTEGKNESAETVADSLASDLEGFGFQVEDSDYEVVSAEATAEPSKASSRMASDDIRRSLAVFVSRGIIEMATEVKGGWQLGSNAYIRSEDIAGWLHGANAVLLHFEPIRL